MSKKTKLGLLLSTAVLFGLLSFKISTNSNETIIGSWVSESDINSKLVFTSDGKCKEYYENELQDTYSYQIANTTPQCGIDVPIDQYTSYLKMTNISDSSDVYCYEINGITTSSLSIRLIGNGGALIYDRQ